MRERRILNKILLITLTLAMIFSFTACMQTNDSDERDEISALRKENNEKQSVIEELESEIEELESEIEDLKSEGDSSTEEFEAVIENRRSEIDRLNSELEALKSERDPSIEDHAHVFGEWLLVKLNCNQVVYDGHGSVQTTFVTILRNVCKTCISHFLWSKVCNVFAI